MYDTSLPAAELSRELAAVYGQVPATRCQSSGECCQLTPEEYDTGYATMFPLYRAEHASIVCFVQQHLPQGRQQELLAFTEERPRRCPFLAEDNQCTIYPVRPLICRSYGVMNPDSIARAAVGHRGRVPDEWIKGFVRRESGMVCPRVRVTEPGKLTRHAANLLSNAYERELLRLSQGVEIHDPERLRLFRQASGRLRWPVRWSWGGFTTLCCMPVDWLRSRFDAYWRQAELANAG